MDSKLTGSEPQSNTYYDYEVELTTSDDGAVQNESNDETSKQTHDYNQADHDEKCPRARVYVNEIIDQLWACTFQAFSEQQRSNTEALARYLLSASKLCQWITFITVVPVGLLILNNLLLLLHPHYKEYKEVCVACVNLGIWTVGFINLWYAWKEHVLQKEASIDKLKFHATKKEKVDCSEKGGCETLRSGEGDSPMKEKTC